MVRRHDIELFLRQSDIFRRLKPAERQRVVSASREETFAKGQTIFEEGRPSDSVWLVMEGRVHLVHYGSDGHVQTTCVMTPGESFCCLPALDRGAYPATAVAATQAKVLKVPTSLLHELMARSTELLRDTFCAFGGRLRQVEAMGCLLHEPVERRLAQALLTLEKKFGPTVPLTRQELAEVVGTTVETTIRIISRFQKAGWVRSVRGKIEIIKAEPLRQLLQ